jgi:hypothetical protein
VISKLSKFKLSSLVVFTTSAGFLMAPGMSMVRAVVVSARARAILPSLSVYSVVKTRSQCTRSVDSSQ